MRRAVVLAVLISFTVVPVAYAQEGRFTPKASFTFLPVGTPDAAPAPAPPSPDRPRIAGKASIERAATAGRVTLPPVPRRSVLTKGWFWGLVGGAVLVILLWSAGGDD